MAKIVLVTGATGKQGGAVVRSLLDSNADFQILAVTRNAQSPSTQKMAKLSPKIKLVQGTLDRMKSSVKPPSTPGDAAGQTVGVTRKDAEETQGTKALIDAALKQHVKSFVYTSVNRGGEASSNTPTTVPYFATKHNIEQYLFEKSKDSNMQWTVLRPVAFFDNITPGLFGTVFCTSPEMVLEDKPLQLIAKRDNWVLYFAARAFLRPDEYHAQCLSLAGDELKFSDLERIFEEKTGQSLPLMSTFLCRLLHWASTELYTMCQWFRDPGYQAVRCTAVKAKHPGLMDFSIWLEKERAWKS